MHGRLTAKGGVWELVTWFSANEDMRLLNAMTLLPLIPSELCGSVVVHLLLHLSRYFYPRLRGLCEHISPDRPGGRFELFQVLFYTAIYSVIKLDHN